MLKDCSLRAVGWYDKDKYVKGWQPDATGGSR